MILVDDLKPALHSYGDPVAISPNLDRLASRGMQFDLAYTNQAVCAPSRINLMTGARSTSSGIYHFGMSFRDYLPGAVTLPQHFKAAGYHAESMGKVYHIGHGTTDDAASWSVPHHKEKVIEYLDPGGVPTQEEALFYEVPVKGDDAFAYARTLARGSAWEKPDVPDDAYADGRTAARAIGRLRALPTLAALAGLGRPQGPQPIDGETLMPVLRDPDARVAIMPTTPIRGRAASDRRLGQASTGWCDGRMSEQVTGRSSYMTCSRIPWNPQHRRFPANGTQSVEQGA